MQYSVGSQLRRYMGQLTHKKTHPPPHWTMMQGYLAQNTPPPPLDYDRALGIGLLYVIKGGGGG